MLAHPDRLSILLNRIFDRDDCLWCVSYHLLISKPQKLSSRGRSSPCIRSQFHIISIGLLIAAFLSDHRLIQVGGAFVLAIPASCVPIMLYMNYVPDPKPDSQGDPGGEYRPIRQADDVLPSVSYYSPPLVDGVRRGGGGTEDVEQNNKDLGARIARG